MNSFKACFIEAVAKVELPVEKSTLPPLETIWNILPVSLVKYWCPFFTEYFFVFIGAPNQNDPKSLENSKDKQRGEF